MEITSSGANKHSGWKLVRVFISSTFRDLGAERDYLVRFVFPKLRLELLKWHVHLLDIDLRWGVAEMQDTIGVCTEIIDECRPRFICILGENYGSVIEGQDKSYTIMEIEHSLRGLPAGDRPKEYRFFYFRDPDVLKTIPEADLENSVLVDKNPQKRETLKEYKASIIAEGFNPYIYRTRWDKKLKRLVDLEDFGDHVYNDILGSVIDELGDEPPKKLGEFDEENAAMDAFVEDRSSRFFPGSHEPLMMKITSFAEREDWPNILVVVGGPGSGKSALLSKFYLDYTQAHERDLVIGHFVGASIGSADLRGTLRRICHEMGSVGDLPQDTGDLVTRFAELVNKATKSFRVVLIIDALNQMSESFNPQELNWLPANLPKRLRIIVSSTDEKAIEDLRHKRNVDVQSMDLLCREDKLVIIENFLGRYGKTMIDDQKETIVKKKESGYPLYLLVTLEELRTLGTRSEIVKSLLDFPGDAQSLFSWILKERLSNDPGFRDKDGSPAGERLVRDFLALLASSRYGLTQEELVDLIDPGDKLGNVAALQRFLRPYLMFRGDRLDFYHNQFRQAAKDSYLESEKVRKTYHKRLAEYFKDVPASRIDRLVEEYPYQLSKCQECDSLAGALSNLGLFVLAWEQGRKHEWMGYWKLLCSKYDPNIWYTIACQEEDRKGTITKNGWLYHVLGWFLMEMEIYRKGKAGNYSIAKAMFEKSLQIHENLLDPNHPSLAEVLNGIAVIYSTQGKWEEALKVLERVLSLRISGLGANHPKVAVTFNNIGISHYNLADWQKALHEYRSALKIYDMSNDVVLPGSADTHNNIGLICREKRRYKEALHNYEKALEIMDGVFDLYNPNKATVLSNMGDLYCDLENYEKAEHCYSRALDISEKPPYDRRAEEFQEKMENVRKRIKSL